jgi:hypothetical protein
MNRTIGCLGFLVLAGVASGCVAPTEVVGYPVYPNPTTRLPRTRVAKVFAPIRYIDGRDVSAGRGAFDVLPGIHRVELWTDSDMTPDPGTTFVLDLKPGFTYTYRAGRMGEEDSSGIEIGSYLVEGTSMANAPRPMSPGCFISQGAMAPSLVANCASALSL